MHEPSTEPAKLNKPEPITLGEMVTAMPAIERAAAAMLAIDGREWADEPESVHQLFMEEARAAIRAYLEGAQTVEVREADWDEGVKCDLRIKCVCTEDDAWDCPGPGKYRLVKEPKS